jgi:hypothetical protein
VGDKPVGYKGQPPRLTELILDLSSLVAIDPEGLALCPLGELRDSSEQRALRVCGDAEVGHGNVSARWLVAEGPAVNETLVAFNGRYRGEPAIFAHVTSDLSPAINYVLILIVKKTKGTFGTSLAANIPPIAGYISAFDLTLQRRYSTDGVRHSYVSAFCPPSKGVNISTFKFARLTYVFEDWTNVSTVPERNCIARGFLVCPGPILKLALP